MLHENRTSGVLMRATDHSVAEPASLKEQGGGTCTAVITGVVWITNDWGALSRKHEFPPDLLKCTNTCSILATPFLSGKRQKFLVINMVIGNIVEMRVH